MIKIAAATQEHLNALDLLPCYVGEVRPAGIPPHSVTFLNDDVPLAIFGGHFASQGVLQVWGLVSTHIHECPIQFFRAVKGFLDFKTDELKIRRVQISIRAGYQEGWKWAKSLGFKCEGTMQKYGPDGSDYWLFGRVA